MKRISIFFIILLAVGGIYYFSETTIHIIRHGEKIIAPNISDAPLTDLGKKQAFEAGKFLECNYSIPQLYASPMRRARETALIIAELTNSSIIFDKRLTEKNYRKSDELYPDGTNVYVKFLPNGDKETKIQHFARMLDFFKEKIGFLDKEIWIVAHGGLIRRILEKIERDTGESNLDIKIKYCSTFTFKYNKFTGSFKYIKHKNINSLM